MQTRIRSKLLKYNIFFTINILLFLFISPELLADVVSTTKSGYRQDTSVTILSYIFGYISDGYSDVIVGESILKPVFETLNCSISLVGIVIVSYITFVSLINSAHSGTPLGQKWHTMFLPMRVVLGSGMLLPNPFTGYSFAQVIIMWFILSGVNIANKVWDNVVLAHSYTKGIFDPDGGPKIPNNISNNELTAFYNDLRLFSICIGGFAEESNNSKPDPYMTDQQITLDIKCQKNLEESSCSNADSFIPKSKLVANTCKSLGISFGNNLHDPTMQKYATLEYYGLAQDIINSIEQNPIAKEDRNNKLEYTSLAENLVRYQLISFKYLQGIINSQETMDKKQIAIDSRYGARTRAIGWLTAGTLYYEIVKSGPIREDGSPTIGDFKSHFKPPSITEPILSTSSIDFINILNKKTHEVFLDYENVFSKTNDLGDSAKKERLQFNPVNTNKDLKILDFLTLGLNRLVNFLVKEILNTKNLFGYADETDVLSPKSIAESLRVDPLNRIAIQGDSLLVLTEELIGTSFWVLLATYGIGTVTSLIPLAGIPALLTMIAVSIGVIFSVVAFFMLFYPIGILMNIYIPLIPLFVWLFGVIGWLLLCIEAMVAAPIVAIGLMHPDGNEVLGKAEQGLMMILNLMLRPVLMIVGLVASIILVRVVLLLFSWGINIVLDSGLMPMNSTGAVVALSFIYAGMVSMFVQQSFRLINQVPDKVLTWIGGPGASIGEEPFTQHLKQEADSGGRKLGDIGSSAKSSFQGGYAKGTDALQK